MALFEVEPVQHARRQRAQFAAVRVRMLPAEFEAAFQQGEVGEASRLICPRRLDALREAEEPVDA